jgi:endonuclease/exonuclease/phosphatase family metal-dependent hydrolase
MPPRRPPIGLVVLLAVIVLAAVHWYQNRAPGTFGNPAGGGATEDAPGGVYQFCFWNVENLFDDRENPRLEGADKVYDRWFAENPSVLRDKLDHLSQALVALNGGRGPDILAVVEVESERAAELLRDALNARLPDRSLHYEHVLMKEIVAGRHIAPAILSRLPVRGNKTRLHGNRLRILEGHIVAGGHDLVILATHWTSRVSDKEGERRDRYADQVWGVSNGMMRANRQVDLLVCGDFNDPPDAESVTRHLHATGDRDAVRRGDDGPLLFNLMAGKDPARFGTHYHRGWVTFDQVAVSPGLLDDVGWGCDPDSVEVVRSLYRRGDRVRRPWAFGSPDDKFARGYSDHFPVTLRLHVAGAGSAQVENAAPDNP